MGHDYSLCLGKKIIILEDIGNFKSSFHTQWLKLQVGNDRILKSENLEILSGQKLSFFSWEIKTQAKFCFSRETQANSQDKSKTLKSTKLDCIFILFFFFLAYWYSSDINQEFDTWHLLFMALLAVVIKTCLGLEWHVNNILLKLLTVVKT